MSRNIVVRTLNIDKYLAERAAAGSWYLQGYRGEDLDGAVVIPALAESSTLFSTLRSLAANPVEVSARYLVVVVVNNRPDAAEADKRDNYETLHRLADEAGGIGLNLAWVDAATAGNELPLRGGGVGMARKLGLDLALRQLDCRRGDPLLVCLDADTLVRADYLPAIERHFSHSTAGGVVIPFRHQTAVSAAEEAAIVRYELFLRAYVLGLRLAGSPYAFHTVGSAMACRASAYVKMGGMNTRSAGEDFYFLQQLHRTSGISELSGTVVRPSARPSHRVPFGTGRSISRLLSDDPGAVLFYDSRCFNILGRWLSAAGNRAECVGEEILQVAAGISPELGEYLKSAQLEMVWDRLRKNHPSPAAFANGFHGWFDGLKTMKLIHHLSDTAYPRTAPEEALPPLMSLAGLSPPQALEDRLELLREMQQQEDPPLLLGV